MQHRNHSITRFVLRLFSCLLALQLIASCGGQETVSRNGRILVMGDSMMAWNRLTGRSVSSFIEQELSEPVFDRSVSGAQMTYRLPISGSLGMNISHQFKAGARDWVVLNGGGNDLLFDCGCGRCENKLDSLISENGDWGAIASLLTRIRATGANVIYVGYLRSPGVGSLIEHCRDEGDELEARISRFAEQTEGIYFVSLRDLVPHGDRSYHAMDMIHPSPRASRAIARRVTEIIRK